MRVLPTRILPSQDFLKPDTIAYIKHCISAGELNKLPPTPIVRKNDQGKLVAIDGHNLIAVKIHLGEEIEVHLAASPDDGLPETSDANIQRNRDLKERFEVVISGRKRLEREGINTFDDLMSRYKKLF